MTSADECGVTILNSKTPIPMKHWMYQTTNNNYLEFCQTCETELRMTNINDIGGEPFNWIENHIEVKLNAPNSHESQI